jgi:UbiA prenyltransferase family
LSSSQVTPTDSGYRPTLTDWAQLVRLPNVLTIIADVAAAFLLVSHGAEPIGRFIVVVVAGISLYWAGMILNDVFDIEKDRLERPNRPLSSDRISIRHANFAGWTLLIGGVALASASGFVPATNAPATYLPAVIAVALALMIVLYDGPLKKTPLASVAMGGCRVLSFLLGASPVVVLDEGSIPKYLLGIALGFGTYIMGVTTMARREAVGGRSPHLLNGLVVTIAGVGLMAYSPRLAANAANWNVDVHRAFPLLIGMIALPVVLRGFRLLSHPSPEMIQATIRAAILSIIPFAAAFTFLGAGPFYGLAIFGLVVPAIALSIWFRVT